MKKDIDDMAIFFRKYPFCFLINPDGIIFLSSKPEMVLKSFWPMDKTTQQKLIASQQFGNKLSGAVTKKEIVDGTEVTLEGKDYFVSRKVIDSEGWSMVLLTTTDRVWIYKLTGILATIFVCFLIMVFSGILYLTDRSREAIRQSEEKFRLLSDQSLLAIGLFQGGLLKYVNQAYCDITGYTFDEIMKWRPDEYIKIIHPDDRTFVIDQAEKKQSGNPDVVTQY
jgi:PAS domain-containing protein